MCNNSEESSAPSSKRRDFNRTKKSDESIEILLTYLAIESDLPVHTDYAPVRPASGYKYIFHFVRFLVCVLVCLWVKYIALFRQVEVPRVRSKHSLFGFVSFFILLIVFTGFIDLSLFGIW